MTTGHIPFERPLMVEAITSMVVKLKIMWDNMGQNDAEQQLLLSHLEQECIEVYSKKFHEVEEQFHNYVTQAMEEEKKELGEAEGERAVLDHKDIDAENNPKKIDNNSEVSRLHSIRASQLESKQSVAELSQEPEFDLLFGQVADHDPMKMSSHASDMEGSQQPAPKQSSESEIDISCIQFGQVLTHANYTKYPSATDGGEESPEIRPKSAPIPHDIGTEKVETSAKVVPDFQGLLTSFCMTEEDFPPLERSIKTPKPGQYPIQPSRHPSAGIPV